ncbi:MAG: cation:proton antiporter [Dysgonamonadaceae bacterium]|jgi:CPA2 family monovalent cation:H+ antiporter-2|nr:cation:proton antiporter [Dysgonamonadaceae bacterium]
MTHIPALISDLALILITAGFVTILFKWLKQPVVLGYIIAGFLISPHFYLLPSVADTANVNVWAEIGVIFLLFALGLEFSFKKLMKVGGSASIATFINMGSMIAIGYLVGQAMHWTQMECLFLGGMLSMSSTTIIIKAFNDMGLQKKKFASIVFGMLIVEDLAAILMMVLLSTIAVSKHFEGVEMVNNILKLGFFMLIWFVVGIYLIPTILKKLKKYLNDETLLIVSIGLCLGMVLFANSVGFSAALGAFIMGSILAETVESKHIEHLVEPIKNLFGAVFFVSVGMMIVPNIIVQYAGPILILTAVVLIGRVIFATLGVMASGESLKIAGQSGFSLAQIGEFSFIIATLGMQLGVISDFIYPIIVAVSVITTFTTPYFIKASTPAHRFLEKIIPSGWEKVINGYAASSGENINRQNDWKKLLQSVIVIVLVYFTLSFAILIVAKEFLYPLISNHIHGMGGNLLYAFATILLMAPFMSAIMRQGTTTSEAKKLWNDSRFNKAALISLDFLRTGICVALILAVLIPLFPHITGLLILISICVAVTIAFSKGFNEHSERIKRRFFLNLNNKDYLEEKQNPLSTKAKSRLKDRNIHIEEFVVSQDSLQSGKTLEELDLRNKAGINVISIVRGDRKINIPDGKEQVFPFDRIFVSGTDEEMQKFSDLLEEKKDKEPATVYQPQIQLSEYTVEKDSPAIGHSIKDLNIQKKTECLITGIERKGEILTNLSADFVLEENDILLLAGEKYYLKHFEKNMLAR